MPALANILNTKKEFIKKTLTALGYSDTNIELICHHDVPSLLENFEDKLYFVADKITDSSINDGIISTLLSTELDCDVGILNRKSMENGGLFPVYKFAVSIDNPVEIAKTFGVSDIKDIELKKLNTQNTQFVRRSAFLEGYLKAHQNILDQVNPTALFSKRKRSASFDSQSSESNSSKASEASTYAEEKAEEIFQLITVELESKKLPNDTQQLVWEKFNNKMADLVETKSKKRLLDMESKSEPPSLKA